MSTQQLFSFFMGLCLGGLSVISSLTLTRTILFSAQPTSSRKQGGGSVLQTLLLKSSLISLAVLCYVERKELSAAFIGAGVVVGLCSLLFIKRTSAP
jgi:hypothetical protein